VDLDAVGRGVSANSRLRDQPSGACGIAVSVLRCTGRPDARAIASMSGAVVVGVAVEEGAGMNSIEPRPNSLSTPASATELSGAAWFDGTPRPSCATCSSSCELVNPMAPSRMAARTSSCIAATSSSVAVRSDASSPIT
jgi:hypothetical protein